MSAQGLCHLCGEPTLWVCAPDGDYGWIYCCSQHDHEPPTTASHPPSPAAGADNRTTTHTTPETGAGDEGARDG